MFRRLVPNVGARVVQPPMAASFIRSFSSISKPMRPFIATADTSSSLPKKVVATQQCSYSSRIVTSDAVLADNGGSNLRPLVSVKWLKDNLHNVKLIDASWRMNHDGACAKEFEKEHIPGAMFFDLDEVADKTNTKPHTVPSPEVFAAAMGELGISEVDHIVVYDSSGLLGAARMWWTLCLFGAKNVRILDGGFPAWKAAGNRIATGAPRKPVPVIFTPSFNDKALVRLPYIRDFVNEQSKTISSEMEDDHPSSGKKPVYVVDARSPGRFSGTEPEPRPGIPSGHMPGALNIPYGALLREQQMLGATAPVVGLKTSEELRAVMRANGLNLDNVNEDTRVVTTCGSGMTAATLYLALHSLGVKNLGLYDGSWTEYAAPERGNTICHRRQE